MKHIFTLISLLFFSLLNLNAENRINLGEMQLDTEYALESFKNYIGTFTAPRTGVLSCEATTNDVMYPYKEVLDEMGKSGNAYKVTMNSLYGGRSYDFNVEEGKTYVMYAQFIMNDGTVFKMTMAETPSINLKSASPEIGSEFNVSNSGQISFDFDKAVAITGATLSVNSTTQKISGSVSNAGVFFDVKSVVWDWLKAETAKPGDSITITLNGVSLATDKSVLYNGDGVLEAKYALGPMPAELLSTENTKSSFLSYYRTDDETGIVKLHFSQKISPKHLSAQLKYGSIDKDADGDYYVEYLQPTVSEDGLTVLVNLQGKRRRPIDMVSSGTDYESIALGITGVFDEHGNYAYASGSGSLGSYWFNMTYKEVTANVVSEFTPSHGSSLEGVKNIEVWITDEEKLSYDGVEFAYEKEGIENISFVEKANIKRDIDPDDDSARILTIPVPAELTGATDITLTFRNLQCADGSDHSSELRVKYNAFIVSRSNPMNGATMEWLTEGQVLKLYVNRFTETDELAIALRDLSPAEGEDSILFEGIAEKNLSSKNFEFTCVRKYRLERAHDYRLEVLGRTLLDGSFGEYTTVGEDYVTFVGAADPFRYSDMLLASVTPDSTATVLSMNSDNIIQISFDGLVTLPADENYILLADGSRIPFDEIAAENPAEDGYSTTWNVKISGETITKVGEIANLHIVALDLDGHRVEGNADKRDYSYILITYATDCPTAISSLEAEASASSEIFNLAGQKVGKSYKGIVIQNNRKIIQ